MMALTHATIAAAGTVLFLRDASPLILGLSVLGSQLPDVDTSTSLIGQICFPVSRWLEARYPHRSVTHSFLATGAIAILSLPLWQLSWKYWAVLPLAHLLTSLSDTFTKQGVQLFFPAPVWCVFGSNPNRRLSTGGNGEYWVLAGAMAALILAFNITNSGGLELKIVQFLGLREGTQRVYNTNAGSHHVYIQIQGAMASDRSPINKRFFVLGQSGSQYIVMDADGIYKVEEQIVPTKTTIEIGGLATTKTEQINFDDESPVAILHQLQSQYSHSLIVLSGELKVDSPEDISLVRDANKFDTIKLSGETLTLEFAPLNLVKMYLQEQYVTGFLTVKIINPLPTL